MRSGRRSRLTRFPDRDRRGRIYLRSAVKMRVEYDKSMRPVDAPSSCWSVSLNHRRAGRHTGRTQRRLYVGLGDGAVRSVDSSSPAGRRRHDGRLMEPAPPPVRRLPPPSGAMERPRATVMVGRVPHDDESGGDPLPAHRTDGDAVHARLGGERRHDVIPAPYAPRLANLYEIVGKQRCNPARIDAAHRVEQLELATDGGINVVDVVHGADRTAPTERASDRIAVKAQCAAWAVTSGTRLADCRIIALASWAVV